MAVPPQGRKGFGLVVKNVGQELWFEGIVYIRSGFQFRMCLLLPALTGISLHPHTHAPSLLPIS